MTNKLATVLDETEDVRNSERAPPSYDTDSFDADHAIPPPDLTAGFTNLKITPDPSSRTPTTQECIAHLKLLECFYRLQQSIGSSDGLFGINDSVVTSLGLQDSDNATLLAKLAEKRWSIYIARAVDRYEAWSRAYFPSTGLPNINDYVKDARDGKATEPRKASIMSQNHLPPVDVLLVWHAYMLNPRAYFEDCLRNGRMQQWHQAMPWEAVAQSIDSNTFIYSPGEEATITFVRQTGRDWDDETPDKHYPCPKCDAINTSPWTMIDSSIVRSSNANQASQEVDDMLSQGQGFCDRNFQSQCKACDTAITSEYLKVGKFCLDLDLLLTQAVPMPGTLFTAKGIPSKIGSVKDRDFDTMILHVNTLFSNGLGTELFNVLKQDSNATIADIRKAIDTKLKDRRYMHFVRGSRLLRPDRMAIRRMMSRYWENSSPATTDLVSAVIRQGSFTEKMHNIDWLHSPALPSTMQRLIQKYSRFIGIMARNDRMAVPTLDVDLAWHTHQLNPCSYCNFTVSNTSQFVNHDDKVAETDLNTAFAWTSKQYQRQYGEPYSECTCWYCEAVRESHTSAASRLFNTQSATANDKLHSVEQDPRKSVHISAHNAVRPTDDHKYNSTARSQAAKLERAYEKACDRAQSKGRKVPKRDDYYYSDAYGYPVYLPAYSPYVGALYYTPLYYPVAPGCMALGAGAVGNCCSGTCGAGAAAGGCGGFGSCGGSVGGCGASAGGCGGGGGGGCGGGGGGGCGGGGGG